MADDLPRTGIASTYSDSFQPDPSKPGLRTATGEHYSHLGFTAAIMPHARWYVVPMGTLLRLKSNGRCVVVKLNDRGGGNGTMARVLDLSHAAYAHLAGVPVSTVSDRSAGLLTLDDIETTPAGTPLGPVSTT